MKSNIILGLDIGGTGIKGALVDIETGKLISERLRIKTPSPANPDSVADVVQLMVQKFEYTGEFIGCGFPAIIDNGVAKSAANIDKSWIGTNVEELFSKVTNKQVFVLNDADAAGVAEVNFGMLKNISGVGILLTLGTGIGSAVFVNGNLVPNTEFGHLYLKNHKKVVEKYTSNLIRKEEELSYEEWASRLKELLNHLDHIFSPNIIVLGGGVSKRYREYKSYFKGVDCDIESASLLNQAGLIGAAMFAVQRNRLLVSQDY